MTGENDRMTLERARAAVDAGEDGLYAILLEHGTLEIGFYRPRGRDEQEPHDQDEVYVIVAGSGRFVCAGRERAFEAGEALFVPAGAEHRFVDFSEDFEAWVVFYGPRGGESPAG